MDKSLASLFILAAGGWVAASVFLTPIRALAEGAAGGVESASSPAGGKSALESDDTGWVNLLPDKELHPWKRLNYPGKALKPVNPWTLEDDGKTLRCDGTGTHENLFYDKPLGDGIFHVEWRFTKVEGAKGYNSGVFVRSSEDGKIWHQAQVGDRNVGYLFGSTLKDGKAQSIKIDDKLAQRGKEAGEWNVYEITCQGPNVTLWINGAVTAAWKDCEVRDGSFGLEAEGWLIEFRNLQFKPMGLVR